MALDGPVLQATIGRFEQLLRVHRERLNQLNVFPVADRDTGANMWATVAAIHRDVMATDGALGQVASMVASAGFEAARGNSGVILAQLLDGFARTLGASGPTPDGLTLIRALRAMATAGPLAVAEPVAGTMLTVVEDVADEVAALAWPDGAHGDGSSIDLSKVAQQAASAARRSVHRTPDLLAVLANHHVVDSGAAGLALFFDALAEGLGVSPAPSAPWFESPVITPRSAAVASGPPFELMMHLDLAQPGVTAREALRTAWSAIGDSVSIAGLDQRLTCHLHTDDVESAIAVARRLGRPSGIRVEGLAVIGDGELDG